MELYDRNVLFSSLPVQYRVSFLSRICVPRKWNFILKPLHSFVVWSDAAVKLLRFSNNSELLCIVWFAKAQICVDSNRILMKKRWTWAKILFRTFWLSVGLNFKSHILMNKISFPNSRTKKGYWFYVINLLDWAYFCPGRHSKENYTI